MRDPDTFEARLATAYRRYADEVSADVDPMVLARAIVARPARMPMTWSRLRPLRLALLLGLVVALALVAAALVGGQPSPAPRSVSNGWIAYATVASRHEPSPGGVLSEIYLVRDGVAPRLLAAGGAPSAINQCPDFSPDGTSLAYGEWPGSGTAAIVIVTIAEDGSSAGQPIRLPVDMTGNAPCPSWSPDGRQLAYSDNHGIVLVPLDGTPRLIPYPDTDTDYDYAYRPLEWLPVGTIMVRRSSGTWLVPVDGGSPRQLASADRVSVSPDGSRIALDGADSHVRVVPSSGGDGVEVDLGGETFDPVWSPSGDRIAYRIGRGIGVADADGHDPVMIARGSYYGHSWSPDGRHLLYMQDFNGRDWRLLSTSTTDPIVTGTLVDAIRSDGDHWPERRDVSWQANFE